ncbi:hypothetical protein BKA69DRAFT_422412 [Paraphysoderma sedebokerense]|nr:hypothetical protein BKA69DRAFT_422412 [Paraphysoderma sedebokerense]
MADNTSLLSDQFHQSVAITEEGPWNRFQKDLSQFRLTPIWTEKHLNELGNYNKIIQYSVIIQNLDGGTIQNLVGPYYSNSKGKKHDIADALLKSCFLLDRFPHLKCPDETNYIFSSLNFHLLSLVKLFIPNKSENSSHKILGHISKCLREHGKGRVSIDRLILSGSSGKNTSLGSSSDVDIIAFLNDRRPPFQHDIYESVADILKTGLQKDLECKDLVIGKRSLQFTLMGVEVDLLFAHSFDQKRQLELAIEYLAKIPEDCRSDDIVSYYSTCFSETSVAFIEQQHGNTNIFVRMAKLWASMIMVISKFDSKSYLFELLAVKASEMYHPPFVVKGP